MPRRSEAMSIMLHHPPPPPPFPQSPGSIPGNSPVYEQNSQTIVSIATAATRPISNPNFSFRRSSWRATGPACRLTPEDGTYPPYPPLHKYPSGNSGYKMAQRGTVTAITTMSSLSALRIPEDAWKSHANAFLAMPPEIHIEIFRCLNPIDAVCLSLVNPSIQNIYKHLYASPLLSLTIFPTFFEPSDLLTGSPLSPNPLPLAPDRSCKHCVPVLYYPAHCELHHHIRSFIPKCLTFCSGPCKKFTSCEPKGFSDSHEHCGTCGVNYWRRYQRGRRMIDVRRPGEKPERVAKWYNGTDALVIDKYEMS